VDENSIVADAEERAQQIREEAERDAERVRQRVNAETATRIQEGDAYASHSLERLASHLSMVRERMGELEEEMSEVERAIDTGTRYLQARQVGAASADEPKKDRRKSESRDLNWDAILEPETNGAHANGTAGVR
jgi:DNA repair exonuclease SbcCD ATPase subunit